MTDTALPKKVLLVATSSARCAGPDGEHTGTGVWLEELASPYYAFKAAGFDVDIASPAGGAIPVDGGSLQGDFMTKDVARYLDDITAQILHANSIALEAVSADAAGRYDAVYFAGGHGVCADFTTDLVKGIVETMYAAGKLVVADCHGPVCLMAATKPDGTALVAGHAVTGFSNSEEAAVGLTGKVPYLIESKYGELGAKYECADDWHPKVCVSGNLLTGQNPASSVQRAEAPVRALAA